jgi:hypothetical protein
MNKIIVNNYIVIKHNNKDNKDCLVIQKLNQQQTKINRNKQK